MADLLVGAVTGPVRTYEIEPGEGFSWRELFILTVRYIFPASVVNGAHLEKILASDWSSDVITGSGMGNR